MIHNPHYEKFLSQCKTIHGNTFDYSSTNYINTHTKVTIGCKIHGEFLIRPMSHIKSKFGCPKCGMAARQLNASKNKYKFIEDAIRIHGEKYDYSSVNYENSHKKIEIICKNHGMFIQQPMNHLTGQGCPICGSLQSKVKQTKSTLDFIAQCKLVHGDAYDYTLVDYTNRKNKIRIKCNACKTTFESRAFYHQTLYGIIYPILSMN